MKNFSFRKGSPFYFGFVMEICRTCPPYTKNTFVSLSLYPESWVLDDEITLELRNFIDNNKKNRIISTEDTIKSALVAADALNLDALDITDPESQFYKNFRREISKYCGNRLPSKKLLMTFFL